MAKVSCAVNVADNSSFNGMTIAEVMEQYGSFFNIPKTNLVILVNDEEETDTNYVIQPDDNVEFVKSAGEKGAVRRPARLLLQAPLRFGSRRGLLRK